MPVKSIAYVEKMKMAKTTWFDNLARVEKGNNMHKGWKCEKCGRKLPKTGFVWKSRYRAWKSRKREYSGYYCDPCADRRETGMDY